MFLTWTKYTPGLKSGIDIDTAVADINALERRLKEEIPGLKWCFIEPDVAD